MSSEVTPHTADYHQWHLFYVGSSSIGQQPVGQLMQQPADLFRRMPLILKNAPSVAFRQLAGLFIASFVRPSFSLNDQETVEKTVYKTVDNSNKLTLTEREDALLRLLASHPRMTQKQLADQLGLTERGVRYLTEKLQKLGMLQRQGGKKAGQWVWVQAPNEGAEP